MSKPKVSFIVPVYNVENYIEECLGSLVNQSLEDIEIICVNDGSTDGSLLILEKYANMDDRIKIFTQENVGQGKARNFGFKEANGEYIAFVDSDDWVELEMAEKLYNNARYNNSDLVLFDSMEIGENDHNLRKYFNNPITNDPNHFVFDYTFKKKLVMNHFFVIWSKLYKKTFLEENNIKFEQFFLFEDVYHHVKSMIMAKNISYCPFVYYNYRKEGQSSVMTDEVNTDKSLIIFDIFNEIEKLLVENDLESYFGFDFLVFKIRESKGIFEKISFEPLKEAFFKKMHEDFKDMDLLFNLKNFPLNISNFYFNVIISKSCSELIFFEKDIDYMEDLDLSNKICIHFFKHMFDDTIRNFDLNYKNVIIEKDEIILQLKVEKKLLEMQIKDYEYRINKLNKIIE